MKPITIKYRDGKHKTITIEADRCSGEIPAYSHTYYCIFYFEGAQIARVAKSRLLPGYYKEYQRLFGRPWLEKIINATEIHLTEFNNWESELNGYPEDTERIWRVNSDNYTWVIECPNRSILHIINNDEREFKGDFETAIKAMFPGKKIRVYYPTVKVVEL